MFETLQHSLLGFAQTVPLELFSFVGTILEEIIAPIPSPFVMTSAGSIIAAQSRGLATIFLIAAIAAFGKTLGGLVFYFLADKAEDLVIKRFGRFIGFSHKEVESIGKHFNGTRADDFILIALRAIPVMPSTPISLVAGFIKLNLRTFIVSTFIGNYIRCLIFLYIGYEGLTALSEGIDSLESVLKFIVVGFLAGIVAFIYYKRGKGNLHEEIIKRFRK